MKRTTILTIAILLVMALVLGACKTAAPTEVTTPPDTATEAPADVQPTEEPTVEEGPKYGGVLTFAMKEDVTSLDPHKAIQYGDVRLNALIAQQLVAADRGGNFVGVLAESWDVADDGDMWKLTFNLNPNAKFASGNAVTAADVAYSWGRVIDINKSPAFLVGGERSSASELVFVEDSDKKKELGGCKPVY